MASGAASMAKAAASAQGSPPISATKESPFINSLEMKFVPLPGRIGSAAGERVLISIWDTRVQDYQAFVEETRRPWAKVTFEQGPTHPAVNMSWLDAQAFCAWLTDKEQKSGIIGARDAYRLPNDQEWSRAVGLPPEQGATPAERDEKNTLDFPWGRGFPPKTIVGNYYDQLRHKVFPGGAAVPNYNDISSTPHRSALSPRTATAFSTWAATSGSGATIGSTKRRRSASCAALLTSAARRRTFSGPRIAAPARLPARRTPWASAVS